MPMPSNYWPTLSSSIFYDDPATAIDWLCRAFGFEVRLRIEGEGGRIEHSELLLGDGLIMVGTAGGRSDRPGGLPCVSPRSMGNSNTQCLCIRVDDVDAHAARARAAGAMIVEDVRTDDYGEEHGAHRTYRAQDPEGHQWFFMSIVRERRSAA